MLRRWRVLLVGLALVAGIGVAVATAAQGNPTLRPTTAAAGGIRVQASVTVR